MDEEELLQQYHGNFPFSFGSLQEVRRFIDIDNKDLKNVLSKSNTYTEHKAFKKPKYLPPIRTYGEDYLWEADLMFFTHPDLAKENDGYLYLLAIIDTFTKMVMLSKLKTKDTKNVTAKVNNLYQIQKPKYLRVDGGGEFVSKLFINMCQKNNVKLYVAMEPIKCAMIERFNRTFKRILVQMMEKENSLRWIDFIEDSLNIYHNRRHRALKMTPVEAEQEKNQKYILRTNLKKYSMFDRKRYKKNKKLTKFKRGDFVKIFKQKGPFTKGYTKNATTEHFKIYHIDRSLSKDRYYLKDLMGEKVIGSFYEEYLVRFTPSDDEIYKIDPNFKDFKRKNIRGKPHIFVKWLGWPNKFNQWLPLSEVQHILPKNV